MLQKDAIKMVQSKIKTIVTRLLKFYKLDIMYHVDKNLLKILKNCAPGVLFHP